MSLMSYCLLKVQNFKNCRIVRKIDNIILLAGGKKEATVSVKKAE